MALTQISTDGIKNGTITGTDLATNVDLVDNQKLRLGTGNDLEIFHNGSNSFIKDTGTGNLVISGSQVSLESSNLAEFMVKAIENAQVELYHNGSKKFETLSTGIQVTGNVTPTGYMKLVNNMQIYFGTNNDLEILSDGTNGIIRNHVGGSIVVRANQDILLKTNASGGGADDAVKCVNNGAVELYFDGNKKFETLTNGVKVTGQVDVNGGGISLEDNRSLLFGASDDLQIFHDGSHSRIRDAGTGVLSLESNTCMIHNADASKVMANFVEDGAVELYHNNSKKFETHSAGVLVSGNVYLNDNNKFIAGTSNDLNIFHDGSDSFIDETGTGRLNIRTNGDSIKLQSTDGGTEAMGVFNSNGSVSLYHNGSERFETTSTGFKTTVSNPVFEMQGTGNSGDTAIFLNAGANHWLLRADNSTSANTFSIKSGDTSSSTHRLLINSSGRVGIGETSPAAGLDVKVDTNPVLAIDRGSANNTNFNLQYNGTTSGQLSAGNQIFEISAVGSSTPIKFFTNGSVRKQINADGQTNHNYTTAANPKEIFNWSNNKTGMSFRSASTERGNIFFFDSGVQFNTGSDYRLKENVTSISDGITRVKQLIPRKFNWIVDESNTPVDGFLAHEVSSIVPEAVNGTKDAVATQEDVDSGRSQKVGDPIHQMIDHSKLVPLLAAGLKEAISKIEILETEVAALKAS